MTTQSEAGPATTAQENLQATPRTPYVGSRPFGREDSAFFFGRDGEADKLAAMVAATTLTVMYGESGVGKSSLLRARLLSALLELDPGWRMIYFSEWRPGSGAKLAAAVGTELELSEQIDIGALSKSLLRAATKNDTPILLVLDQFEEFFVYDTPEFETIQSEIAKLANRAGWAVKVLLSLRNDGLFLLDKLRIRIPQIYSVLFRLDPLTVAIARFCITAPIKEYNRETGATIAIPEAGCELVDVLAEGSRRDVLLKRLGARGKGEDIAEAATDEIVVTFLQLTLNRLWTECVINENKDTLDLDLLYRLAGIQPKTRADALQAVGLVVQKSVDSALDRYTPAQKKICQTILDKMVLPSGQKVNIRLRDLEPSLEEGTRAIAEELLNDLSSPGARLIKVVAPPPGEEEVVYQIVHDAMAIPILDWIRRSREQARAEERRRIAEERQKAEEAKAERIIRKEKQRNRRANLRLAGALVGLFLATILGLGFFEIRRHALFEGEVKRLVATAQAASPGTNREPLLMFLSAMYETASDHIWAVDKENVIKALKNRLDRSPRDGGRYSAVAFDPKNARLAWIPPGDSDGDRLYVCSLMLGHNCDRTDEHKQQKTVQEFKVPKLDRESANPALRRSFTPVIGFIDGLNAPVIIDRGYLYYFPTSASEDEPQNDDRWRPRDLAEIIGQRGDLGWTRFDIEGGVIEILNQDWQNRNQRIGWIEYSAEKGFVYSDLTLKVEWDTVGSPIPMTAPGGQFGASLVVPLSATPGANPAISKPLDDCLELGRAGQSVPGQKFPVSIELWKAAPRSAEHPEKPQVAPWCYSLITQIRGGVGFSNNADFVAALLQKRLLVYPTKGFGADPVIDTNLTGIPLEQAQANGQGFTFGPLALHRREDGSFQVAWANRGVRLLTAGPKREPGLDGSTGRSLAAPISEAAVKLKFDDGGRFLFRQDFDVSTRQLIASVWDLRKDWTDYVEEHVQARSSLSELKNFVCSIASEGSSVGNGHVSYTDEEKQMLGWDDNADPRLADPCTPDSQDARDKTSARPG